MNDENSLQTVTKHTPDQENYLDWLAQPTSLRVPKTKTEYAEQLKTSRMTLWRWEEQPGFDQERLNRIKRWQKESTPQIIETLKNKAVDGDTQAIKIWLEWVEGTENKLKIEHTGKISVEAVKEWIKEDATK